MSKFLFGFAIVISCLTFGQKIKIKKGIAYVDRKEFVKVVEDPIDTYSYTVSSLGGNDLFYLKFNRYTDPKEIDYKYGRNGNVSYYQVFSPDINTIYFEAGIGQCGMCHLAAEFVNMIYHSKVINEDGTINQPKLEILSKKAGFVYTQKREELNNGTKTVIIQDSRPKD
jgi:hypothetical protein